MIEQKKILSTLGIPPALKGYDTLVRACEVYPTCKSMEEVYNILDGEIGKKKGCSERRMRYAITKAFANLSNPAVKKFRKTYGEETPDTKIFLSILCSMV